MAKETIKGELIDFIRDGLNHDEDMLTEFQGQTTPDELYLFFSDKGYSIGYEECVKIAQAKQKFEELNPVHEGIPPVNFSIVISG